MKKNRWFRSSCNSRSTR